MKDADLIAAVRYAAQFYDPGTPTRQRLNAAADRLEALTKQPEPHPQQLWNVGRKGSEDFND